MVVRQGVGGRRGSLRTVGAAMIGTLSALGVELARAGYRGLVDVEGDGTAEQLRNACVTVRNQAREAGLSI